MSWNVNPNCHVRIWKNDVLPPGPPVGVHAYDGPGQLMVPFTVSGLPSPYRGRLALSPGAVILTNSDIQSTTTQCWLRIADDVSGVTYRYYKIVDMSVSTGVNPLNPAQYIVTAVFLMFVLSA